jgi:hypothetical protein
VVSFGNFKKTYDTKNPKKLITQIFNDIQAFYKRKYKTKPRAIRPRSVRYNRRNINTKAIMDMIKQDTQNLSKQIDKKIDKDNLNFLQAQYKQLSILPQLSEQEAKKKQQLEEDMRILRRIEYYDNLLDNIDPNDILSSYQLTQLQNLSNEAKQIENPKNENRVKKLMSKIRKIIEKNQQRAQQITNESLTNRNEKYEKKIRELPKDQQPQQPLFVDPAPDIEYEENYLPPSKKPTIEEPTEELDAETKETIKIEKPILKIPNFGNLYREEFSFGSDSPNDFILDLQADINSLWNKMEIDSRQELLSAVKKYDNAIDKLTKNNVFLPSQEDELKEPDLNNLDIMKKSIVNIARVIQKNMRGSGKTKDGTYESEINSFLRLPFLLNNTYYLGTFANDELPIALKHILDVYEKSEVDKFALVLSVLNRDDPRVTHWTAIYFDLSPDKMYIGYYDSFADPPTESTLSSLKDFAKNLPTTVKIKVNKIPHQKNDSMNCAQHTIDFIIQMDRGATFQEATDMTKLEAQGRTELLKSLMDNKFETI